MATGGKRSSTGAGSTLKASDAPGLADQLVRNVKAQHAPALVVMSGEEVGQRVVVEGSVDIGRDPDGHLVLSDALVSWHHARIEDRGDSFTLVDPGSTNGTKVNGRQVSEHVLAAGDTIEFGSTVVRYELEDHHEQQYNAIVQRLLNVDDLSGLYVRRKFDQELTRLLEAARRNSEPLALLVMDLDGIKGINDTHGHLFGAYTIGEAGKLIGEILDELGVGCRFGGDEFLAALPRHDREAGRQIGERIRERVNAHHFVHEGVELRPGISIGVASFPAEAPDATSLFKLADEAMYRAKQGGKNRVCI